MDTEQLRKEFNSKVKPAFKKTHTPQCKRCGFFAPWDSGACMQIHHILPLIDGGNNAEENLVVLCPVCHSEWHNIHMEHGEFSQFLQSVPLHIVGALLGMNDCLDGCGLKDITLADVAKNWGVWQDAIRTRQPYKNEQCKEYVKKHCKDWVDW
jgi:hypothetical protein